MCFSASKKLYKYFHSISTCLAAAADMTPGVGRRSPQELIDVHTRIMEQTEPMPGVRGGVGYYEPISGQLYVKKGPSNLPNYYCLSYTIDWDLPDDLRKKMKKCKCKFSIAGQPHDHERLPEYMVEGHRIRNRMRHVAASACSMDAVEKAFDLEFQNLCVRHPECHGKWLKLYRWMKTLLQGCFLSRNAQSDVLGFSLRDLKKEMPSVFLEGALFFKQVDIERLETIKSGRLVGESSTATEVAAVVPRVSSVESKRCTAQADVEPIESDSLRAHEYEAAASAPISTYLKHEERKKEKEQKLVLVEPPLEGTTTYSSKENESFPIGAVFSALDFGQPAYQVTRCRADVSYLFPLFFFFFDFGTFFSSITEFIYCNTYYQTFILYFMYALIIFMVRVRRGKSAIQHWIRPLLVCRPEG